MAKRVYVAIGKQVYEVKGSRKVKVGKPLANVFAAKRKARILNSHQKDE